MKLKNYSHNLVWIMGIFYTFTPLILKPVAYKSKYFTLNNFCKVA